MCLGSGGGLGAGSGKSNNGSKTLGGEGVGTPGAETAGSLEGTYKSRGKPSSPWTDEETEAAAAPVQRDLWGGVVTSKPCLLPLPQARRTGRNQVWGSHPYEHRAG